MTNIAECHFANKVHMVKTMILPIVMYGHEGWTINRAEC